ncbi:MAG: T9SS type A sorting domain-containing protein [Paludibacteraceae bacterium]
MTTADEEVLSLDSANWRIKYNSPCLDKGKVLASVASDYLYLSRPQGFPTGSALFDIGAYELPYHKIVIGAGSSLNGTIYDASASLLADGAILGYADGTVTDFLFEAAAGYKLQKAYYITGTDDLTEFGGQEVEITEKIDANGIWHSVPLVKSLKLYAVWIPISGLKSIDSHFGVYAINNNIVLSGLQSNDQIDIYTITGKLIYSEKAAASQLKIQIEKGVYIIRINNGTKKIVVD